MSIKGRPIRITRNTVASKCLELYWKKGIQNVTYNKVIKYSSYSKRTVYNLFKNEDELQAKTLEYYNQYILINYANKINKQENILDFIEFMFKNVKNNHCYYIISNSNKYLLNDLSKSCLIKLEKNFKKIIHNLIIRHINKFNLKPKKNEINSLVIYLIHNITLANILKVNKAKNSDLMIIKNAMIEKTNKFLYQS